MRQQSIRKYGLAATVAATLAMPVTAHYEGLRVKAFIDTLATSQPATICFGETLNVKMGDTKTVQECKDMLTMRLGYFAFQVDKIITVPMSPETHASLTSFTYNCGVECFKKSSIARLANSGKMREACDFLLKYNRAGGKVLNGLVKRREAERQLCLSGL